MPVPGHKQFSCIQRGCSDLHGDMVMMSYSTYHITNWYLGHSHCFQECRGENVDYRDVRLVF